MEIYHFRRPEGALPGSRSRNVPKGQRVNIRIAGKDLELIQERALKEGIPYQTLMASILHKYAHGTLTEN